MSGTEHRRVLGWEEVAPAARACLDGVAAQGDMGWVREAWEKVTAAGKADYGNALERARVAIRLLNVCKFYPQFAAQAHDDSYDFFDLDALRELEVDRFHLAQLIGDHPDFLDYDDADDFASDAAQHLAAESFGETARLLGHLYGGSSGLFLSLWRALHPDETDEDGNPVIDWEIVNCMTDEKMPAFRWLYGWVERG